MFKRLACLGFRPDARKTIKHWNLWPANVKNSNFDVSLN